MNLLRIFIVTFSCIILCNCAVLTVTNDGLAIYPPIDELMKGSEKIPEGALFNDYASKWLYLKDGLDIDIPQHEVVDNNFEFKIYDKNESTPRVFTSSLDNGFNSALTISGASLDAGRRELASMEKSFTNNKDNMTTKQKEIALSNQIQQQKLNMSAQKLDATLGLASSMASMQLARFDAEAKKSLSDTITSTKAIGKNPLGIKNIQFSLIELPTEANGLAMAVFGGVIEDKFVALIKADIDFIDGRRAELIRKIAVILYQGGFEEINSSEPPYQYFDYKNLPEPYNDKTIRGTLFRLLSRLVIKDLSHIAENKKYYMQ